MDNPNQPKTDMTTGASGRPPMRPPHGSRPPMGAGPPNSASLGHDHFEIFAGKYQCAVARRIELVEERVNVRFERGTTLRIERAESFHERAVILLEDVDPVGR